MFKTFATLFFCIFCFCPKIYLKSEQIPLENLSLSEMENLIGSGLYKQAIEKYTHSFPVKSFDYFHLLYWQASYLTNNFDVLCEKVEPLNEESLPFLFLQGKAFQQEGLPEKALEAFFQAYKYCSKENPFASPLNYELAATYLSLEKHSDAKKFFNKIDEKNFLYSFAKISLAYLALQENATRELFEELLHTVENSIEANHPLIYEVSYLRGLSFLKSQNFEKAIEYFQKALPPKNCEQVLWYEDTTYQLAFCYLCLEPFNKKNRLEAENFLYTLLNISEGEQKLFKEVLNKNSSKNFEEKTEGQLLELVKDKTILSNSHSKNLALLLLAELSSSFQLQEFFSKELIFSKNLSTNWQFLSLYQLSLMQLREAENSKNFPEKAQHLYLQASDSLEKSVILLEKNLSQKNLAFTTFLRSCQAWAYFHTETFEGLLKALAILKQNSSDAYSQYIFANFALHAAEQGYPNEEDFSAMAEESLKNLILDSNCKRYHSASHYLLGLIYFKQRNFILAQSHFNLALENNPFFSPQAMLGEVRCMEELGCDLQECRKKYQKIIALYPESNEASEANFNLFTMQEYLHGDKKALKHLESYIDTYPQNPLTLNALYLLSLDYKRARKNNEGKWLRHKNLFLTIEVLQKLENTFLGLANQLDIANINDYSALYFRARLDRAQANLTIALESKGSKKKIYLEYAKDLLEKILADFSTESNRFAALLMQGKEWVPLREESFCYLAKIAEELGNSAEAKNIIRDLIARSQKAKISHGKILMRSYEILAQIAQEEKNYAETLELLNLAENAGKGGILSSEHKLTLWLKRSTIFTLLNEYDNAMLWLSRVVNDETASSLRLKAMLLRAEIYQKEGRHDLARKQLQALAKYSGEYSEIAKEQLEKNYAY